MKTNKPLGEKEAPGATPELSEAEWETELAIETLETEAPIHVPVDEEDEEGTELERK